MQFFEKLQFLRKEKLMTQEELAEKLNVSRQAVSKWEANQTMPEIEKIMQIADLFDVSIDYLLKDSEQNIKHSVKNDVNRKKTNRGFIMGIVVLSLGFLGILTLYILYISLQHQMGTLSLGDFLNKNDTWIFFLICFMLSFLGGLLIFKNTTNTNIISELFNSYKRQNRIMKYGIALSLLGAVAVLVSYIIMINHVQVGTHTVQQMDALTGRVIGTPTIVNQQPSIFPFILFASSLAVMVSGIVTLIIGFLKKSEVNEFKKRI